jgi:hypothetical protein
MLGKSPIFNASTNAIEQGSALVVSDQRTDSRGRVSSALFVLPLIVTWAIVVAICLVTLPSSFISSRQSVMAPTIAYAKAGTATLNPVIGIDVVVTEPTSRPLVTQQEGVVTSVDIAPGSLIANGVSVVHVNGVPVEALVSPIPLYRDLSIGMKGPDVLALSQFLMAKGELSSPSQTFGYAIANAVRSFSRSIGVPPTSTFARSYAVWVPTGVNSVQAVSVQVGDSVGPGASLATPAVTPNNIVFTVSGRANQTPDLPNQRLKLTAGGLSLAVATVHPTPSEYQSLINFLEKLSANGTISSTQKSGTGAEPLTVKTFTPVNITVAEPAPVATVPTSAIYATSAGVTCIFTAGPGGSTVADKLASAKILQGSIGTVGIPIRYKGVKVVTTASSLAVAIRRRCE